MPQSSHPTHIRRRRERRAGEPPIPYRRAGEIAARTNSSAPAAHPTTSRWCASRPPGASGPHLSPTDVPGLYAEARADGYVAEIALPVVAVEHVGVAAKMGLEDIQVAVRVEVSRGQAHARLFLSVLAERQAGFQALLGERAVTIVVEQQAGRGIAGHVDIGPAVAVEIGRRRGEGIARLHGGDAGLTAHVGEGAVAVVVAEA